MGTGVTPFVSESGTLEEPTTALHPATEFGGGALARNQARDRCTLTVLAGPIPGSVIVVDGAEAVLGRSSDVSGCIPDRGISREHARLFRKGDRFYVEDLQSTNGTFVDGQTIEGAKELHDGARIQLGGTVLLRFHQVDVQEYDAVKRLYESAVRDPLTQVHNRRYFDERMQAEFAYSARHATSLSILLVDLDRFKSINDTYGHLAGDAVLRVVAATIQRMVRVEDVVARYGGEEFCVVARGTDARNASILAERIRKTVAGLSIPWEGEVLKVTLSVGVATFDHGKRFDDHEALIAAADTALYQAKHGGRNRCCVN